MHLHQFHQRLGACFVAVNGVQAVAQYRELIEEYKALRHTAGVLDLSFRSRLCLTGRDRVRFLHGQVTNDIQRLRTGQGCYAALVTAKGKLQSDLNIYHLQDELLLDFEPGMQRFVSERLEKYIVADDVQVVDVAEPYGLLSMQGPKCAQVIHALDHFKSVPANPFEFVSFSNTSFGELYLMNQPRLGTNGFDLFVPEAALESTAEKLLNASQVAGGGPAGWQAFEMARIEAGVPRFGVDMDERHFPQECGIESRAVSYSKGCYIGQEVLNRIHTLGHVNRQLCALRLAGELPTLPQQGAKLFHAGKEAGYLTSAATLPVTGEKVALGYVRKELNQVGVEFCLESADSDSSVVIREAPCLRSA